MPNDTAEAATEKLMNKVQRGSAQMSEGKAIAMATNMSKCR
jgi:hypothetical protein